MRIRSILTLILLVNVVILLYFLFRTESIYKEHREYIPHAVKSTSMFKNPGTAYMIYTLLDSPESIDQSYYNMNEPPRDEFLFPHLELFRDDGYCRRVKKFITHLPEVVFNETGIFTDFSFEGRFRTEVIPLIGEDVMPEISFYKDYENTEMNRVHYLRRGILIYFTDEPLHYYQDLGKDFACGSQMYNHIPGHGALYRNDMFSDRYYKYVRRYKKADALHCFNFETFYPDIWNLDDETDCDRFFNTELIRPFREKISYVRKLTNPLHSLEVDIVLPRDEESLKEIYENGELCGTLMLGNMVQRFVDNPLLIEGYKFELRAYMLIASTNPLIVYYHDGFVRRALFKYDDETPDVRSLFPNMKMNKELLHEVIIHDNMTEDQVREFRIWDYEQLGAYLYKENITGANWTNDFLRPYLKSALIHVVRSANDDLLKRSTVYELVAVDFLIDTSFNLWFMESNMRAIFFGSSEEKVAKHKQMLIDMFDIIINLTRSRMKRVFKLVAEIEEAHSKNQLRGMSNEIKETKLEDYRKIEMNYFEPEYSPRQDNKFELIIDENKADIYNGLLNPECIV